METAHRKRMKKIILKALVDLLKIHSFSKITKEAICKKAEVGQTTFYRYYTDKYDVLSFFMDLVVDNYFSLLNTFSIDNESQNKALLKLYEMISNYSPFFKTIINYSDYHINCRELLFYKIFERNAGDKYHLYHNPFNASFHIRVIEYVYTNSDDFIDADSFKNSLFSSILDNFSSLLNLDKTKILELLKENN